MAFPPRVASMALALVLAGCAQLGTGAGPDAVLPGVRTESTVQDTFACGPLLFPAGCVVVRIASAESGCAPQVPGYVLCNATLAWGATSGSAVPQARLVTSVNGTAGPSCEPAPASPCTVNGTLSWSHAFGGPGEARWWNVTLDARLDGAPDAAAGEFTLRLAMKVRAQDTAEADA